jgi:hypothetical protein
MNEPGVFAALQTAELHESRIVEPPSVMPDHYCDNRLPVAARGRSSVRC